MEYSKFSYESNGMYVSLIYQISEGEIITEFDNGMLMNNTIKGINGYTYEKGKDTERLIYNISRGVKLSVLRHSRLNTSQVLSVLEGISLALSEGNKYMLSEANFVLNDEYVFVDINTYEVILIYVPTNGFSNQGFAAYMKESIVNGIFDIGVNSSIPMEILSYLNSNPYASVEDIQAFLHSQRSKLLGSLHNENNQPAAPQSDIAYNGAADNIQTPNNSYPAYRQSKPQQPQQVYRGNQQQSTGSANNQPASFYPAHSNQSIPQNNPSAKADKGKENKSGFFGNKKKKSEKQPQSQGKKANSSFGNMNIPGMAVGVPNSFNSPSAPAAPPVQHYPRQPDTAKQNKGSGGLFSKKKGSQAAPSQPLSDGIALANPQIQQSPEYQPNINNQSPHINMEIEQSDQTVFLNPEMLNAQREKNAYLMSVTGQKTLISKSEFLIGRMSNSEPQKDFSIKNQNVGRIHALITKKNGQYFITDMTSLNGTFVNNQRIGSNIETEIKNGDLIKLANEAFKFIIE